MKFCGEPSSLALGRIGIGALYFMAGGRRAHSSRRGLMPPRFVPPRYSKFFRDLNYGLLRQQSCYVMFTVL